MMVDDHTKADENLKAVASQHKIPLPAGLDDKHRELHDKLAKLSGPDFDREYMDAMVNGHEEALDKLESRIDRDTLTRWKSEAAEYVTGKKAEVRGKAVAIIPEKTDDMVRAAINRWAADSYPTVYAHLESAKTLDDTVKHGRSRTY